MRKLPPALVLLLALMSVSALAVAGCGGDDGGSGSEGVTTEQYITQADTVCSAADKTNESAAREAFGNQQPTKEEAVAYIGDLLVPSLEAQLEELRAITPPEGDADTVNAIYDQLGDAIDTVKEDPEASLAVENPFADVRAAAEAYGFKSCGVS